MVFMKVLRHINNLLQCRGRSYLAATEGGVVAGADVQPAVLASGGNGESNHRTAGQRSTHPVCDGGHAASQAEVTFVLFCYREG